MHRPVTVLFFVLILSFIACRKEREQTKSDGDGCTEQLVSPLVSSNSPVNIGGRVELMAQSAYPEVEFEWRGPENFYSTVQYPVISPASYRHNGRYLCRIKRGGCLSIYSSVDVVIPDPCAMVSYNMALVNGVVWNFYSGVQCGPTGANGYFGVAGVNNDGMVQVVFGNRYEKPKGYSVFPVSVFPDADSATVQVRLIENGTEFIAASGEVFCRMEESKTLVTFCGMVMQSQLSTQRVLDARLGCED